MFNKQLKRNIKGLDLQIGKLSEEIENLQNGNKYEIKMEKLEALTELREKLIKGLASDETSDSVDELDAQIKTLTKEIKYLERDDICVAKLKKLEELVKIRCELSESKVTASYTPHIISGVIGLTAMLMVIRHEETNIITTKALGLATKMFRGL